MPRTSLALLIWKGCWCLSAYLCQKWCTWFYQQEYGIKTSKTSLLHKSSEKVGPQKMLESTFSELWKLAKGLQQSNFFFFFLRKIMKLSKNSELWGILTCSNPRPHFSDISYMKTIHFPSAAWQPPETAEWSWISSKALFPKNYHHLTYLIIIYWKTPLARTSVFDLTGSSSVKFIPQEESVKSNYSQVFKFPAGWGDR